MSMRPDPILVDRPKGLTPIHHCDQLYQPTMTPPAGGVKSFKNTLIISSNCFESFKNTLISSNCGVPLILAGASGAQPAKVIAGEPSTRHSRKNLRMHSRQ